MDQALIEQIVANVLQELQPAPTLRAEVGVPVASEVYLDVPVVTAEVLQDRVKSGQTVRMGTNSILTPTARDWLKTHNVRWQRAGRNGTAISSSRRLLLIGTVTPAVRTLRETLSRGLPGWSHELLGSPSEIADAASRAINTASAELVVAISDAADVVACRVNRHERVRAAVVASAEHLRLLVEHLGPNVLAINPRERSFFELRNLLRMCAVLPSPHVPQNWK